jgi:hypothetical protein
MVGISQGLEVVKNTQSLILIWTLKIGVIGEKRPKPPEIHKKCASICTKMVL